MSYRVRQLLTPSFPKSRRNSDDPLTNFYAAQYEVKAPKLGGNFIGWKKQEYDSPVTPDQAARQLVEIYDDLVEGGEIRVKDKGKAQFSPELGGISVFVRVIPEAGEETEMEEGADGKKVPKRRVYRFSVFTQAVFQYHIVREDED